MPNHDEELLTFRTLYDSPMIGVRDYICRHIACGPSDEEQSEVNGIVLMRHGAFSKHFGKRRITADVNQAVFFSKDSVYRVSHPADCGDRGTTFTVAQSILNDIIRELDPTIDDSPDQPFPFVTGPCESSIFWRHREFVRRLESSGVEPLEPLWADVTGLQLVADVLENAFERNGAKPRRRASTAEDHLERTDAAKIYLASRISESVTLDDVAAAVHASPFNFARIFQEQTGLPIHRYLTLLRLRAALDRIADPHADLTEIALDLGFSSHSHFTDVFRREFGEAPSAIRQKSTTKAIREMSKNLIA
ncbi:MAG: AraC family transcriptional regulator [Acidobacteriota bacterium]